MKNKFRKLFRKYEDIKISFLDVFKSRKNKIKVIWNGFKTNSSNNISINKKKNKKNYFFSKINFSNFKASKIHDYFFVKKTTDISKVNKNTQNIKSKEKRENNFFSSIFSDNFKKSFKNLNKNSSLSKLNLNISIPSNLRNFLQENLKINSNKTPKDSVKSIFNFKNFEKIFEQNFKIKIPDSIKDFYKTNVSKNNGYKDIILIISFIMFNLFFF